MMICEEKIEEPIVLLSKERYEEYKKYFEQLKEYQKDSKELISQLANEKFEDWVNNFGELKITTVIENRAILSDPVCSYYYTGGKEMPMLFSQLNKNVKEQVKFLIEPIRTDVQSYVDRKFRFLKRYRLTTIILSIALFISLIGNIWACMF